jgi:magnesium chelatase subunit H
MKRIILIAGFESFNAGLYRQAAELATLRCPDLDIRVFSDRDITAKPKDVEEALSGADVFFGSLLFDYDQVLWLRDRLENVSIRLIFESALELMSLTKLGDFAIGDKPKGMPKPIKFILDKFSNGREEDKLAGYISFLKIGPKLLKFVPVGKVQDLRNWLIIYGYWNAGGSENVAALFWILGEKYLGLKVENIPTVIETPNIGLLHPDYQGYFESPKAYLQWYQNERFDKKVNNKIHNSPGAKEDLPPPVIGILLYRKHVITKQSYIPQLIRRFEEAGLIPLPIFINGVEGHVAVRDLMTSDYEINERSNGNIKTPSLSKEAVKVDGVVSTIGFPLVGGPAGSMEAGRQVEVAVNILNAKNIPYFVAAPLLIQDIHSWTRQGIGGLQSVVLYALPELDGAIDTVPLGGLVGEKIYLVPERVERLIGRVKKWVSLRQTPPSQRKIAVILYGFPPGYGATGTAALLNVPKSLVKFLQALKDQGYNVGEIPEDGEEIIRLVKEADENFTDSFGNETAKALKNETAKARRTRREEEVESYRVGNKNISVGARTLEKWLGYLQTSKIEKQWKSLTGSGIKTHGDELHIGGVEFGNVWIGVQPPLGIQGDPLRLMFERDLTPHPQYAAFYKWLQNDFQADAVVHFGMHGTVEWLPGSALGNTGYSWSDILLGNLPNLYIYAANNPSESILAKRRGYGVLVSHNVPPYGRAGLYKDLVALRELIAEYREDSETNYLLKEGICKKIVDSGIESDCPFEEARKLGISFTPENIKMFSSHAFDNYLLKVYEYLQVLENRLFSSGLHVFGMAPDAEEMESFVNAYFETSATDKSREKSQGRQEEEETIRNLLNKSTDELTNLLRGLNGEYIPPAPGGDLLRDGAGVLPTGRNIHALDPYRMPSPGAYERGREIGRKIISQHLKEYGEYPETVAVMLWGLDAIKTKGESLGILLELVGAQPIKEGTGRIVRYELMPLDEVGHPRIDILANLSGIFRDSFVNIIELLDDLFQRAAIADESPDQNFIRKHSLELKSQGIENVAARLFSNPAGDFGSLVNDQIVDGNWENSDELGDTWQGRNAFSYGKNDKGKGRPEILKQLLKTTSRIVQEIDSVEYGLTDIQEYYANTGGLKKAAEKQKGKKVKTTFVESFSQDTTPRDLDDLLRMEYRTKLLNPKWAQAMATQGSGGAYEISQRMTALIGWGATADFTDDWVYDQAVDTYALDKEMADKLRQANPEAFRNIIGRMLEAHGRGFWQTNNDKLQQLRDLYQLADEQLEGVTV